MFEFATVMRVALLNTGTELLAGDVQDTHLAFIAREIFELGLRFEERRTVGDGIVIRETLKEIFPRAEIVFVTGGLGPTSDDITRELVSDFLSLELLENSRVRETISRRLALRRIPATKRIWRQALVPRGGQVLPNENGTAPGIYIPANISPKIPSPHLFLLPGPPRELEPMFRDFVVSIVRQITAASEKFVMRSLRIANVGESIIEKKI